MELGLKAVLERFYDYLDRNIAQLEAQYPFLKCPQGCTVCCNTSIFLVTKLEFVYLAGYVAEHFSKEERARFVAFAKEQVKKAPLAASDLADNGIITTPGLVQVCPFVTETGCSVYPARPALCRLYGRSAHMDGRINLCKILVEQARTARGEDSPPLKLPTVERFTFILAAWLKQEVGKRPEVGAILDDLMAINSLCAFIVDTDLDLEKFGDTISLI